jgi:hypothetical protein
LKRKAEILFSLMMVCVFAYVVYAARGWRIYAKLLPWVVGIPLLVMALSQLALDIRKREAEAEPLSPGGIGDGLPADVVRKRTLTVVGYLVGLFFSIWLLGFSLSIPLFVFLYLKLESGEGWWFSLLLSTLTWGFIIGLFEWLLDQPFPSGLLMEWLMNLISPSL